MEVTRVENDPNKFIIVCKTAEHASRLLDRMSFKHDGKDYKIMNIDLQYSQPGHYSYLVTIVD